MGARVILGNFNGEPRLRIARDGFDAGDTGLTNEQLVYDSTWRNVLSLHQYAYGTTDGTLEDIAGLHFQTIMLDEPLDYNPVVFAWRITNQTANRLGNVRFPCLAISKTDRIHLWCGYGNGSRSQFDYIVFKAPIDADLASESVTGVPRLLLGNHPNRGTSGFWQSRRGANVLTAPDGDMLISTDAAPIQVSEAGTANTSLYNTNPGASSTNLRYGYTTGNITLSNSYPNRPAVVVAFSNFAMPTLNRTMEYTVQWTADNKIKIQVYEWPIGQNFTPAPKVLWAIFEPDKINSADGGASASSMPRVLLDESGLKISKRDVSVTAATADQMLLDTSKSMLYLADRDEWSVTGAANTSRSLNVNPSDIPIICFKGKRSSDGGTFQQVGMFTLGQYPYLGWCCYPTSSNTMQYISGQKANNYNFLDSIGCAAFNFSHY
ncbi:hypothetical protein ACT6QH_01905 [Xanthobacter sp. TB0139]|uniref:hypothetical protein n=1 Tax=Xanthobacter sp. TB0139 TaxID=3459178 RepID=UPI004039740C